VLIQAFSKYYDEPTGRATQKCNPQARNAATFVAGKMCNDLGPAMSGYTTIQLNYLPKAQSKWGGRMVQRAEELANEIASQASDLGRRKRTAASVGRG
jgi:hypothetical protein